MLAMTARLARLVRQGSLGFVHDSTAIVRAESLQLRDGSFREANREHVSTIVDAPRPESRVHWHESWFRGFWLQILRLLDEERGADPAEVPSPSIRAVVRALS